MLTETFPEHVQMGEIVKGHYNIFSVNPGHQHFLTMDDGGKGVAIARTNDSNPREPWIVEYNAAVGSYNLTLKRTQPKDRCLDLEGAITTAGTSVLGYPLNHAAAQQWKILEIKPNSGIYNILYFDNQQVAVTTVGDGPIVNVHINNFDAANSRQQWYFKIA